MKEGAREGFQRKALSLDFTYLRCFENILEPIPDFEVPKIMIVGSNSPLDKRGLSESSKRHSNCPIVSADRPSLRNRAKSIHERHAHGYFLTFDAACRLNR